jgi:5-methylcytosine-specific restriction endonuclease McrA
MSNTPKTKTLLLNSDYCAIAVCDVYDAFIMLYQDKVEVIEWNAKVKIRSVSREWDVPSIIRLKKYVNVNRRKVALNKRNIFIRDKYECVYCGSKHNLTLDHIIPKSRGGKDSWDNLVTCCSNCNSKKGDKPLDKSGLKLRKRVYEPAYLRWFSLQQNEIDDNDSTWNTYLMLN